MRGSIRRRWHVAEVFLKIASETHYLWRAIDPVGEILASYITKKRDKSEAVRFFRKALKYQGSPVEIVADGLKLFPAALKHLGIKDRRRMGR